MLRCTLGFVPRLNLEFSERQDYEKLLFGRFKVPFVNSDIWPVLAADKTAFRA